MSETSPTTSSAPSPGWSRGRALAWLLGLALALRLALVLAPPRDLWPDGKGMDEELWRGTSALELIEGPLLPVLDHQINPFSGGSLVVTLLDVPLYLALGSKLWVMRLATLPFQLLGVAALYLLLEGALGRKAAFAGALLLALPPPGYAIVGTTAWGTHLEGIALGLALALAALAYLSDRARPLRKALCYGLLAGFCLYFGYLALVLLAALVLLELWGERGRVWKRGTAVRALAFVVGLSPWIAYQATHGFNGLSPYNKGLGEHMKDERVLVESARSAWAFVTGVQAETFYLPDLGPIAGRVLGAAAYAVLVLLALHALWGLWRARRSGGSPWHPARLACLYLPLYLLAYVSSDFRIKPPAIQDYRYAMPIYPWLVVLAATAVAQAGEHRGRLARGALYALALLFGVGSLWRCDFGNAPTSWTWPGNSDTVLARTIFLKYPTDEALLTRVVERLAERPPDRQHQTLFVLGQNYKQMLLPRTRYGPKTPPRESFAAALEHLHTIVAPPYQPYFEPPAANERGYKPSERKRFWQDWTARKKEAPPPGAGG